MRRCPAIHCSAWLGCGFLDRIVPQQKNRSSITHQQHPKPNPPLALIARDIPLHPLKHRRLCFWRRTRVIGADRFGRLCASWIGHIARLQQPPKLHQNRRRDSKMYGPVFHGTLAAQRKGERWLALRQLSNCQVRGGPVIRSTAWHLFHSALLVESLASVQTTTIALKKWRIR
jgi:hypothetical protein